MSGTVDREWLDACEGERERLRRELHDGFCQKASAALLALDALMLQRDEESWGSRSVFEQLEAISTGLRDAVDDVQAIATRLSPTLVTTSGLVPALQALAEGTERHRGIPCAFDCDGAVLLPNGTALHVYRAVQELLAWTVARLAPESIRLSTESSPPVIAISAKVRKSETLEEPHTAMSRMTVAALGGTVEVRDEPPGEILIVLRLPDSSSGGLA